MAKKQQQQQRQTNWTLIYSIIGAGAFALVALLIYSVVSPQEPVMSVDERCETNPEFCISLGDESAPVSVLEISDFGCPHCQNFHNNVFPTLKENYVDTGQVNWIILPFSLWTDYTLSTANAAMCANEQGLYSEYSDELFANFRSADEHSRTWLVENAEAAGLDVDEFSDCVSDGRYIDTIEDNISAARRSQVSGTPSFFINGERFRGQSDNIDSFAQAIESAN